jgi:hypothetical protein
MKLRTTVKVVAATAGGLALALPQLPAVGQSSSPVAAIRLASSARIADRGAVAFPTATVVCPEGDVGQVSIELTETSGHAIAQGYGYDLVNCTGQFQDVQVALTPSLKPFVVGNAYGQSSIFVCDLSGCGSNNSNRTVKLHT